MFPFYSTLQEPVLFATTIMENIRFGKLDASDEEVYTAARKANAHEFISSFPDGYSTVVGGSLGGKLLGQQAVVRLRSHASTGLKQLSRLLKYSARRQPSQERPTSHA